MLNLQQGQKIAGFEVKGTLGAGGMGAVYLVWDPGLQQSRALKVIKIATDQHGSRQARHLKERFMVEARTLAAMDHPGIIRVFQVGELADMPYLVMEYFAGRDLGHWLRASGGRPDVTAVVSVIRQLAVALDYAQSLPSPVVHRDIKLANALLDVNGVAKLIDFGLAKSSDAPNLTQAGVSVGTMPFWAPEFAQASYIRDGATPRHTAQTDLWALGVSMYILLTNNYPIYDTNHGRLCVMVAEGNYTPLDARRPDISPSLVAVVHKLLAAKPEDRFESARLFLDALDAVGEHVRPGVAPPPYVEEPSSVVDAGSSMIVGSATGLVGSAADALPRIVTSGSAPTIDGRAPPPPEANLAAPRIAKIGLPESDIGGDNPFASNHKQSVPNLLPSAITQDGVQQSALVSNVSLSDAFSSQSAVVIGPSGFLPVVAPPVGPSEAPGPPSSDPFADISLSAPSANAAASQPDSALSSLGHQPGSANAPPSSFSPPVDSLVAGSAPNSLAGPSASGGPTPPPSFAAPDSAGEIGDDAEAPQVSVFGQALDNALHFQGAPSRVADSLARSVPPAAATSLVSRGPSVPDQYLDVPTPSADSLLAPAFAEKPADKALQKRQRRALLLPTLAAVAVVTGGLVLASLFQGGSTESVYVDPTEAKTKHDAENELAELNKVASTLVPPHLPRPRPPEPSVAVQPVQPLPRAAAKGRRGKRKKRGAATPTSSPNPGTDDPWAKRFGSRELNATSHKADSDPAGQEAAASATKVDAASAKGTRIPARLKSDIASSPAGPVIVTVTTTTMVGGRKLRAGTELHGRVTSATNSRVLVDFSTVRLKDGTVLAFTGRALARDGRAGLRGRKTLGGASDIASSALEAGAQSAVDALGNAMGKNPAGAGVKAGGSTAAGKARHLNTSQSVLVVKKSTRILVYVVSIQ